MERDKIHQSDPDRRYRRVLSASTLAGDSVKNSAGDDLGKVEDIVEIVHVWAGDRADPLAVRA